MAEKQYKWTWTNFEDNKPVTFTLRSDASKSQAKEKEGDYGKYTKYNLYCEGGVAFSASEKLYEMLSDYKAGDRITITRTGTGMETRWNVEGAKQNPVVDLVLVNKLTEIDGKLDHITSLLEGKKELPVVHVEEEDEEDAGAGS